MNTVNHPFSQYRPARTPRYPRGLRPPARQPAYSSFAIFGRRTTTWTAFLILMAALALALLPVFVIGGTYTIYMLSGRTLPGVSIGSFPAGDLTRAELVQKIDSEWNHTPRLVVTDGKHSLAAAPVDVGLSIDAQATADRAYRVGRGDQALQELLWIARFGKLPVQPVVVFDGEAGRAGLERLAQQINQPALNASLRLENGDWVAVPGQNGMAVDVDSTLQNLSAQHGKVLSAGMLPLVTHPVAPRVNDLTPVLDQLRAMIDRPLPLQAYDPITDEMISIPVPREEFATWVTVNPQGDNFAVGLDTQRVAAYLNAWQSSLAPARALEDYRLPGDLGQRWQNGRPLTLTVLHNPTSYTVESGDTLTRIAFKVGMPYWKIQQANPEIDPDSLITGQVLTIPSKNDMLPLPVIPNKRIVISISQQHLWTYENGGLRSETVISTGIDRSPTIPGIYQIRTHELEAYASVWDLYMPHFMGIYEGWPGFMNGLHGLPTLSSGSRLWAGNLGRPVSYGCIILGLQEAEDLFNWAEEGVVVEIQP